MGKFKGAARRPKASLSAGPEGRVRLLAACGRRPGWKADEQACLKSRPAPPLRAPFLKAPAGRAALKNLRN